VLEEPEATSAPVERVLQCREGTAGGDCVVIPPTLPQDAAAGLLLLASRDDSTRLAAFAGCVGDFLLRCDFLPRKEERDANSKRDTFY